MTKPKNKRGGIITDEHGNVLNGRKKGGKNAKGVKGWPKVCVAVRPENIAFMNEKKATGVNKVDVVDEALNRMRREEEPF